jgi:hypothetical protein
MSPSHEGTSQDGQSIGPAPNLDQLSKEEAEGDKPSQSHQWPDQPIRRLQWISEQAPTRQGATQKDKKGRCQEKAQKGI